MAYSIHADSIHTDSMHAESIHQDPRPLTPDPRRQAPGPRPESLTENGHWQAKQVALIEQLAHEDRKVMTLPHMADVAQV